jgi:hypothetical protein
VRRLSFDDAQNVAFLHDQQIFTVDLDLGTRPLAEQNAITGLDIESLHLAGLVACAGADGDDLAFLRLFLGSVGDDDAAFGYFFRLDAADENAVVKRSERHVLLHGKQ